ncbi:MAG TPA: hypothetical protein DCP63_15785 [Bacteroidetes bacterium]|nr:hypothetical protein [Bacteroidota bacterium]
MDSVKKLVRDGIGQKNDRHIRNSSSKIFLQCESAARDEIYFRNQLLFGLHHRRECPVVSARHRERIAHVVDDEFGGTIRAPDKSVPPIGE